MKKINKEIDDFIAEVEEVVEPTVAELKQAVFDVKLQYDTLLNYLKPMMPHDMLVAFAAKKKEIFG